MSLGTGPCQSAIFQLQLISEAKIIMTVKMKILLLTNTNTS